MKIKLKIMSGSISVVMLTYNNYEKFTRCMSSLGPFIHDRRVKEFIVLDNGSYQPELKDALRSLDHQIKKFRVIFSDTNLGIARGRKYLFDIAGGDYIVSFDSDVVMLNPRGFVEVLYKTLEMEGMVLVGGGGGDHPFFPSMEREDIVNQNSPESPDQIRKVDEVAGWFHGFKKKNLKKHGGFLEMDEQFTPFWGEDSDFCLQIRVNGGKSCIMGKGLVAHQWSSCDKKETQTTLEQMWIKFQKKWYPRFNGALNFKVDEKFYEDNYPESKKMIQKREHYLKVGMIKGNFYSKGVVHHLFPEVGFLDNTKLRYGDEEMTLLEFDKKYFTLENIEKECFHVVESNIPEDVDDLVIFSMKDKQRGFQVLKSLISLQYLNIVVVIPEGNILNELSELSKKYELKYAICYFPEYNFDLIDFSVAFRVISQTVRAKRVINIGTQRDLEKFTSIPLSLLNNDNVSENKMTSIDRFNLSILNEVISLNRNMGWNSNCCYIEDYDYLKKLFETYPMRTVLDRCLRIPQSHSNFVSPRCCPTYAYQKLFGFMKSKNLDAATLSICVVKIDTEKDLERARNNLKYFSKTEIVVLNNGELKNPSLRSLGCDNYHHFSGNHPVEKIWGSGLSGVDLNKYSNVVFTDLDYELVEDVDEFLERSRFNNVSFLKRGEEYSQSLFSVVTEDMNTFFGEISRDGGKIGDAMKKISLTPIWIENKTEEGDEIVLSYEKHGRDMGEDFPMI